jgi:hypothetical protein
LMTWSNNPPARLEYNSKSQKLDFIEPWLRDNLVPKDQRY